MARLLTESFELDQGNGAFLRVTNSSSNIQTSAPTLDALRYVRCFAGQSVSFSVGSLTELYGGMFFLPEQAGAGANLRIASCSSGATVQGGVYLNASTFAIEARVGSSTVVGTGPALTVGVLYHVQFHLLIDNAVGVLQVKLDDNLVIDFTGDTQPSSATDITTVTWGPGGSGAYLYDTLTLNSTSGATDNSWPGVVRVLRLGPTGVGTYVNNWSRNTGSTNWEQVDEVPNDGDTTYLFTTTANLYESFSMGDFSVANANIQAIITSAIAKKDSGTVQLAVGIRDDDNSTDYFGANSALATSYGIVQERRTVDPSTGSAWTVAGARATQGLIVSTTG